MPTRLSQWLLQAWRDYLLSPEGQAETWTNRDPGEALAINAARDAELALSGNLKYIQTKEWSNLSFRWILQPTGPLAEHVEAMLEDSKSYPGLRLFKTDPKTGRVAWYNDMNIPRPEIVQKWDFFYFSPLAILMYAEFMRKYMNNPNIRIFKDNAEYLQFLEALEWETPWEKLNTAGIPMPGVFLPCNSSCSYEGDLACWIILTSSNGEFDAYWIQRKNYSPTYWWSNFGSVPLLIEDIPTNTK